MIEEKTNDYRATIGTSRAAESEDTAHQQAPDGGVDDDGRDDLRGGDDGGDGREAR